MPVYFVANNELTDFDRLEVKIGWSKRIKKRLQALQTGNASELALMGQIEADRSLEQQLHKQLKAKRHRGEWFILSQEEVLNILREYRMHSFIELQGDAFEIASRDENGVPEFVGPWKWDDVDLCDFCPQCGSGYGVHYDDAIGAEACLKCGILDISYDEPEEYE